MIKNEKKLYWILLPVFFDGKLNPFIETNRGCPFTCSFCHTGSDYFHKLNKFSGERVKEEINYVAKKASKLGITNLHMADVNFGMYPQDKQVCEWLLDSKRKYGWPLQVMATIALSDGTNVTNIVKDVPIPANSSLIAIGGDQKVVLMVGDRIVVTSDTASSLDVLMSFLEIT